MPERKPDAQAVDAGSVDGLSSDATGSGAAGTSSCLMTMLTKPDASLDADGVTDGETDVLVVGDTDVAASTLGVNPRGGDVERDVPLDEFVRRIGVEIAEQLAAV